MTIRQAILNGISATPVTVTEGDLNEIERKIRRREGKIANLSHYAYIVGRNWAVSRVRKLATEGRRAQAELLAKERRAEETRRGQERETELSKLRTELDAIVAELLPTARPVQARQLGIVRLVVVDGLTDAQCAERFPGTNPVQRYQWKSRGLSLVIGHCSPELRGLLLARANRPR
jgi:hypothetical protein